MACIHVHAAGVHTNGADPRICALAAAVAGPCGCAGRTRQRSSPPSPARQTIIQTIAPWCEPAAWWPRTPHCTLPFVVVAPVSENDASMRMICDSRIIFIRLRCCSLRACCLRLLGRAARAGRQDSDVYPILSSSAVALFCTRNHRSRLTKSVGEIRSNEG